MTPSPESESILEQLRAAWEKARLDYGPESSECIAALEKYSASLLEMGEKPAASESAAKAILGQQKQSLDIAAQGQCQDRQSTTSPELEATRLGSGTVIKNRYRIIRWLGQGGISRVYLVLDEESHAKELALKLAHSNLKNDKDTLEQFANETKAGRLLSHPNLTRVYDSGLDENGHPFIVMEYIEGRTLAQLLAKEKRLAPERVLHIFQQLCDALAHVHGQKMIHSDLKPGNIILINNDGDGDFVKILDFGFSKVLGEKEEKDEKVDKDGNETEPASDAHAYGSPKYMSPEQCQGERQDERSDVYSLACIMFELLSGSPPFTGSIDEVVRKQIYELPGRIENDSAEDGQLVKDLELIIFRSLSKMPEDRYQSMTSLKAALDNLGKQESPGLIKRLYRRFLGS